MEGLCIAVFKVRVEIVFLELFAVPVKCLTNVCNVFTVSVGCFSHLVNSWLEPKPRSVIGLFLAILIFF